MRTRRTSATPVDSFASQKELAELATGWPAERLVAIWNSLPGVTPVKKFKDRTTAATRIWMTLWLRRDTPVTADPNESSQRGVGWGVPPLVPEIQTAT
jgi:hypothetical protein